ncbi:MAG TPA: Ig-like domain-containing protein, partial [Gemmatimonadaceae bacterium]
MLFALATAHDVQAQAIEYTFTKIADTNDNAAIAGPTCVGLNNLGTVLVSFAGQLWQRRDGQPFTQVAPQIANLGCSSINDFDEIAYVVYDGPATNRFRLVRDSNGTQTTLVSNFDVPALDASSRLYLPSLSNNGSALYASSGGSSSFGSGFYIAPSGLTVYNSFAAPNLVVHPPASMNDSLVSVFAATDNSIGTGVTGIYYGGSTVPFIRSGDVVSGGTIFIPSGFRPVINDAGTVAFYGGLNGGASNVFTTTDGLSVTLVGTGATGAGGPIAINNAGRVALRRGDCIYSGRAGAIDQKVIAVNDPIDGSTFDGGLMWEEAINDAGQVAFWAQLADGRRGVYRADPINHPPVASNGTLTTAQDTPNTGTLSASDPDGDPLTYSIVSNGTKGVATIIGSTTGGFSYVPNSGATGTDTFTFQASDGHLTSNLGTITVTIQPVSSCAVNVTSSVSSMLGNIRFDRRTGHYLQKVTIKNTSSTAITGPVSFVLDSLTAGTTVIGVSGFTAC